MLLRELTKLPKKKIEEKITNRILVNFLYVILGYGALYLLYIYAMGRIGNILTYKYTMFAIFIILAIATAVLYVLSFSKSPNLEKYTSTFRNYAHMSLGMVLASIYLNLPFYTRWIPIEAAPSSLRPMLMFLKNTKYEYYVVALLMLIYLVITIVYHMIAMKKLTKIKH